MASEKNVPATNISNELNPPEVWSTYQRLRGRRLCVGRRQFLWPFEVLNRDQLSNTPRKINMEPTNHLFRKENDLNQTSMNMFHVNLQGCKWGHIWGYNPPTNGRKWMWGDGWLWCTVDGSEILPTTWDVNSGIIYFQFAPANLQMKRSSDTLCHWGQSTQLRTCFCGTVQAPDRKLVANANLGRQTAEGSEQAHPSERHVRHSICPLIIGYIVAETLWGRTRRPKRHETAVSF